MCLPYRATEAGVGDLELNCEGDAAVHGFVEIELSGVTSKSFDLQSLLLICFCSLRHFIFSFWSYLPVSGHDDEVVVHFEFSEQEIHSGV